MKRYETKDGNVFEATDEVAALNPSWKETDKPLPERKPVETIPLRDVLNAQADEATTVAQMRAVVKRIIPYLDIANVSVTKG